MHYVILRDDDTNAFTPVECLEKLYRPMLDRGLPVNLAVIPDVRVGAVRPDGRPEQFLFARNGYPELTRPLGDNQPLSNYLRGNHGFCVAQHGYDHTLFEFDSGDAADVSDRLEQGARLLQDAGFARPRTFIAPYDRFSRVSFREAARRFAVISTGWFELRRLPRSWWSGYVLKKIRNRSHWRVGETVLLSHPGCLLSSDRPRATMLAEVMKSIVSRPLTVLVTHWWEYFPEGRPDAGLIEVLHETVSWLAEQTDVRVISFEEIARGNLSLDFT